MAKAINQLSSTILDKIQAANAFSDAASRVQMGAQPNSTTVRHEARKAFSDYAHRLYLEAYRDMLAAAKPAAEPVSA